MNRPLVSPRVVGEDGDLVHDGLDGLGPARVA